MSCIIHLRASRKVNLQTAKVISIQSPTAINSVLKYRWTIKDHQTFMEKPKKMREKKKS